MLIVRPVGVPRNRIIKLAEQSSLCHGQPIREAVPKGGPGVLGDGRNPPLVGTARDGPSTAAVVALWCGKMQEIS